MTRFATAVRAILIAYLAWFAVGVKGQDVADAFAVTTRLATESEKNTRDGTEIILTISNRSAVAQELWTDGDDYRVLLIDKLGHILLPHSYKQAGTPMAPRAVRSLSRRVYAPGDAMNHLLNLNAEFETNALPSGKFCAIITRKTKSWDQVMVAPPVIIHIENKAANKSVDHYGSPAADGG